MRHLFDAVMLCNLRMNLLFGRCAVAEANEPSAVCDYEIRYVFIG